jgi:NAD(P)-dependent dehydrogenase (short-subunit alcohol dehydrogenase family)
MELAGKVVVVTGGAHGIGEAMCRRFAREAAAAVIVADVDPQAEAVAREINGTAVIGDVGVAADVRRIVDTTLTAHGRIDLFCSNAGIALDGALETMTEAEWERIWRVNVMAHVHAARAVLPSMLAVGRGYLLQTASAAGLLSQIGSASYAVTKHGAVAFAEWLAITYGDRGIRVSCLCPQGVQTRMLDRAGAGARALLAEQALTPEAVAEIVVRGLRDERFLILPHPEVAEYFRRKAADYDRWLRGMQRLQQRITIS